MYYSEGGGAKEKVQALFCKSDVLISLFHALPFGNGHATPHHILAKEKRGKSCGMTSHEIWQNPNTTNSNTTTT